MAIDLNLRSNIDKLRSTVDAALISIGDKFNTSGARLSREYLGSDFSQALSARLSQTFSNVAKQQEAAFNQIREGNVSAGQGQIDASRLKAASEISQSVRDEVRHVATLNTSYRRQVEILKLASEERQKSLQYQKTLSEIALRDQYNDKIRTAQTSGKPVSSIITERDAAIDESNQTYDELIAALNDATSTTRESLNIERQALARKKRESDRESSGGRSYVGAAGRGMLAGAGLLGITSIVGIFSAMLSEGMKLDEALSSNRGLNANITGSATEFGKSTSEFQAYGRQAAIASGRAGYDAKGQLTFERGFGMDEGSAMGLASLSRLSNTNTSGGEIGSQMVAAFRSQGLFGMQKESGKSTYVQLPEKLALITDLLSQQTERMKSIDEASAIGVMSMFGKQGYKDSRQIGQIAGNIDQAITNPSDDFRQAFILRALQEGNPELSYYDIKSKQEQGIYGEGNFNSIMSLLKQNFGGNEQGLYMNTARLFGIKQKQAEDVAKMYLDGDAVGAEKLAKEFSDGNSPDKLMDAVLKEAFGSGGYVQQVHAKIKDYMADGGLNIIDAFKQGAEALTEGGIMGVFKLIGDKIVETVMGANWESVGERIAKGAKTFMFGKNDSGLPLASTEARDALSEFRNKYGSFQTERSWSQIAENAKHTYSLGFAGESREESRLKNEQNALRAYLKQEVRSGNMFFDDNRDGRLSPVEERKYVQQIDEQPFNNLIDAINQLTGSMLEKTGNIHSESYDRIGRYGILVPSRVKANN